MQYGDVAATLNTGVVDREASFGPPFTTSLANDFSHEVSEPDSLDDFLSNFTDQANSPLDEEFLFSKKGFLNLEGVLEISKLSNQDLEVLLADLKSSYRALVADKTNQKSLLKQSPAHVSAVVDMSSVFFSISRRIGLIIAKDGSFVPNWHALLSSADCSRLIYFLIAYGKLESAENLFRLAFESAPGPFSRHLSAHMFSAFILGFTKRAMNGGNINACFDKAIDYYYKMEIFSILPTVPVFQAMTRACILLDADPERKCLNTILSDIRNLGITVSELFSNNKFNSEEKTIVINAAERLGLYFEDPTFELLLLPQSASVREADKIDLPELHLPCLSSNDLPDGSLEASGVAFLQETLKVIGTKGQDLYSFQEKLELGSFQLSKQIAIKEMQAVSEGVGFRPSSEAFALLNEWTVQVAESLFRDAKYNSANELGEAMIRLPEGAEDFYKQFGENIEDFRAFANVALRGLVRISEFDHEKKGFIFSKVCLSIADAMIMEQHARASVLRKEDKSLFKNKRYCSISSRLRRTTISNVTKIKFGGFVLSKILKECKVKLEDSSIHAPAFIHTMYKAPDGRSFGVVSLHNQLQDLLFSLPDLVHPSALLLPMVIPPKIWTSEDTGGYLHLKTFVVKMPFLDPNHQSFVNIASNLGCLGPLYSSLNVLGKTPWTVNTAILKVMIDIWNMGMEVSDNLPVFKPQQEFPKKKRSDFGSAEEFSKYNSMKYLDEKSARENKSLRCSAYYRLQIAKCFSGKTIYFPHCVDFRGRAYPIPSLLNHMGDDVSRGVLLFAEAKPLGPNGLYWLKVHAANLYGLTKRSLDDRVSWTDSNIEAIISGCSSPLTSSLWKEAEDPFQFLAVSFELKNALECKEGHEHYLSRIPIHQDGSCNGLQHYAALGRDPSGAYHVNLDVSEKPQDIYSVVVERMKASLTEILREDSPMKPIYTLALQHLSRKLIKQTIMTTVYGVTQYGAMRQIKARLLEIPEIKALNHKDFFLLNSKLTHMAFSCLGEVFNSSKSIQLWLETICDEVVGCVPEEFAKTYGYTEDLDFTDVLDRLAIMRRNLELAVINNEKVDTYRQYVKFVERNGKAEDASASRRYLRLPVYDPIRRFEKENNSKKKPILNSELLKQAAVASTSSTPSPSNLLKSMQMTLYPMNTMFWTTPLGLPVCQPYRKEHTIQVCTASQKVNLRYLNDTLQVARRQQISAFPPNFIHSLDATHMFLTSVACDEAGITFAAVHDSYWTHAATVPQMNKLLRESFVQLHETPILLNFYDEMMERYQGYFVPVKVSRLSKTMSDEDLFKIAKANHHKDSQVGGFEEEPLTTTAFEDVEGDLGERLSMPIDHHNDTADKDNELCKSFKPRKSRSINVKYVWKRARFPDPPSKGTFDLRNVLNSLYFFS